VEIGPFPCALIGFVEPRDLGRRRNDVDVLVLGPLNQGQPVLVERGIQQALDARHADPFGKEGVTQVPLRVRVDKEAS
jgi:hypothetical protein